MTALLMFLAGVVLLYAGVAVVAGAALDTSGRWWVRAAGAVGVLAAVAGIVLLVRAFGFGCVGAP